MHAKTIFPPVRCGRTTYQPRDGSAGGVIETVSALTPGEGADLPPLMHGILYGKINFSENASTKPKLGGALGFDIRMDLAKGIYPIFTLAS